ncbi:hypothetical protein AB4582_16140 [Vibrio splendidus]
MKESVVEQIKASYIVFRWCVVAYSVIALVGFFLIPFPDWVMTPVLLYTEVIKGTLSLIFPEAISAVLAIFATILTPGLIVIYSSSDG